MRAVAHSGFTPLAKPQAFVPSGEHPLAQVNQMIDDFLSGRIRYADDIQDATILGQAPTWDDAPQARYLLRPDRPMDPAKIPTTILPKGGQAEFHDEVPIESKHTEAELEALHAEYEADLTTQGQQLYDNGTGGVLLQFDGDNGGGKDKLGKCVKVTTLVVQGNHSYKKRTDIEAQHEQMWRYQGHIPNTGIEIAGDRISNGKLYLYNRSPAGDRVFGDQDPQAQEQMTANQVAWEFGLAMGLPMTDEGRIALPDRTGHVRPEDLQRPPMEIIKFLPVRSSAQQAKHLLARLKEKDKLGKASKADGKDHPDHNAIQSRYIDVFTATSRPWARSYFIPNGNNLGGQTKFMQILSQNLDEMHLDVPKTNSEFTPQERKAEAAKLQAEVDAQRIPVKHGKHHKE